MAWRLRCLVFFVTLLSLSGPALSEDWNSKNLGIEISLPENWFEVSGLEVEQLGLGKSAVFVTHDDREQCALIVSREPVAGRLVEAFVLSSVYSIYNDMAGFVVDEGEVTVGGEKGYRIVYEAGPKQGDRDFQRFFRVLVRRGEYLYTFQASNSQKEFVKREGELSVLMKKVSWLNNN